MLSYFKWKHDHKEMVKYRERNFKNLEALIEIYNIILEGGSYFSCCKTGRNIMEH